LTGPGRERREKQRMNNNEIKNFINRQWREGGVTEEVNLIKVQYIDG
jgi:hypothetical protein